MKYLAFIRHTEAYRNGPPPPAALMEAMHQFIETSRKQGTLVDTGGLLSSKDGGVRIRVGGGKLTVTDGPFTESKEVIGGWVILQGSREEVLRVATEFLELYRRHWPAFEGELEVRAMFEPGEGPYRENERS